MLSRCPWLSEYFSSVIPIYIAVIFLFTLANFCMATFMDPGVFPRGKHMWTVLLCKFLTEKVGYHTPTYAIECFWDKLRMKRIINKDLIHSESTEIV